MQIGTSGIMLTLTVLPAPTIICGGPTTGDEMPTRSILLLLLVISVSQGAPALAQVTDTSELLKAADEMVQTVTQLRGLEPKSPIKRGVKSREEISQFLNERVQEDYSQGELQAEGK